MLAVPLAVVKGAAGPYDDPKAWVLPILVGLTVVAWLVTAPGPRALWPPAPDRATRLLRRLALASLAWCMVTTAGSIAPALSLFGNFGRGMGLLTTGAAMTLFFVVLSACRGRDAVRDLVDALLLGSAPVCLLGLGQAAGWDGLPRAWDPSVAGMSVRSTFGQHIALGSYLALVIPLTAARLDNAWRHWRSAPPTDARAPRMSAEAIGAAVWVLGAVAVAAAAARWPAMWWCLAPWGVIGAVARATRPRPAEATRPRALAPMALAGLLAAQIAVLLLSRARGPLLGLFVGVTVAGMALLARRRAWRMLGAGAVAAAVFIAGIALLNVPGSPLAPLAKTRLLSRLAQVSDVQRGTPGWFRLEVWKGIAAGWSEQVRGQPVIPGTWPIYRSVVGYGLETELIALDPMAQRALGHVRTRRGPWSAYYLVDRAHNTLLEQLMTGGIVGALLWLALVVTVVVGGFARAGQSPLDEELALRLAGLGAIIAHVSEGQVGIVTAMPLALFWMTCAWVTTPWTSDLPAPPREAVSRPAWWPIAIATAALATVAAAWGSSQWLLSSVAYAAGGRSAMAGKPAEALPAFERSRALMPWLPLPAEAVVQTRLELAGTERDPAARARMLAGAEAALAELRRHAVPGAADWSLLGQVRLAQARSGDRTRLGESLGAFATAAKLAPRNSELLAQWAWALRDAGDPIGARRTAEQALAAAEPPGSWFAWLVLALAARDLGEAAQEQQARSMARTLAPAAARPTLDALIP